MTTQQTPNEASQTPFAPHTDGTRRTLSCAECRRRRIRCDGQVTPCRQCEYYQVPELCHYPARRTRSSLSKRAHGDLSKAYDAAQGVLARLFPKSSLVDLQSRSRQQLLDLLDAQESPSSPGRHPTPTRLDTPTIAILELDPPSQEFIWDETVGGRLEALPGEDDVNGMAALFEKRNHSYLGVSSVPTILRVLVHTSPQLRQALRTEPRRSSFTFPAPSSTLPAGYAETSETPLIDAYFRTVHGVTPMIDELEFRQHRAQGGTSDKANGPWLALFNMVLTLGYIAANDDTTPGHTFFFERAAQHLNITCFASGNLYTLQALILFAGYYLHYLNRPNMASAIIGAAHRMALALGLHQTPANAGCPVDDRRRADARLLTWWCLFCVDTWAGTTLGRPTLGHWSLSEEQPPHSALRVDNDYNAISIHASRAFCSVAARIQDRMTRLPFMTPKELKKFDSDLLSWHAGLHPILRDAHHSPESIRLACLLLQYRYLNQRMTLYRPYLLIGAVKLSTATETLSEDILSASQRCCAIARETVRLIADTWYPNQVLAWNSTWFLYQAALVLLLDILSPATFQSQDSDRPIVQCLGLLDQMRQWRASAATTHDILQFIFDSSGLINVQSRESVPSLSDEALVEMLGYDPCGSLTWADVFNVDGGLPQFNL